MSEHPPTFLTQSRFRDVERVAQGGMGDVWHALDTQLARPIAVKTLRSDLAASAAESLRIRRARFEREARAVAALSAHPAVVTVYDVGADEETGAPWISMQWLPGGTLADRLNDGPVDADTLRNWLTPIADALDAAHAQGIVHRDVKPGNIMFDDASAPHIGDFGIARSASDDATTLTQHGMIVGTAAYASPEQARGEAVGSASDQYSLMSIAWHLLTGERVFRRDTAALEFAAHAHEAVPDIRTARPDLSADVQHVFARALAKDPGSRYATCRDAVDALCIALDPHPDDPTRPVTPSSPIEAPTRIVSGAAAARQVVTTVHAASHRIRRAVIAAALLLLLILLIGRIAVSATRDKQPPASTPRTTSIIAHASTTATTPSLSTAAARDLVTRATTARTAGDASRALQLAQRAVPILTRTDHTWAAYANYEIGASLVLLGRCAEALSYLDTSEQLQGARDEISRTRDEARRCAGSTTPQPDSRGGKAKGRGKHKK